MFQLFMARKTESNFENKKIKSSLFRCFSGGIFLIFDNTKISECTISTQSLQIKIFSELKQNTNFLKVLMRKNPVLNYTPNFGVCAHLHMCTYKKKSVRTQKCCFYYHNLKIFLFLFKCIFFHASGVIF
jgi:hypothetical protein